MVLGFWCIIKKKPLKTQRLYPKTVILKCQDSHNLVGRSFCKCWRGTKSFEGYFNGPHQEATHSLSTILPIQMERENIKLILYDKTNDFTFDSIYNYFKTKNVSDTVLNYVHSLSLIHSQRNSYLTLQIRKLKLRKNK